MRIGSTFDVESKKLKEKRKPMAEDVRRRLFLSTGRCRFPGLLKASGC